MFFVSVDTGSRTQSYGFSDRRNYSSIRYVHNYKFYIT